MKLFHFVVISFLVICGDCVLKQDLIKCYVSYNHTYLAHQENVLPQNMYTLIEILRRIESNEEYSMTARTLSIALVQGFRQDGIVPFRDPPIDDGVVNFKTTGFNSYRYKKLAKMIHGNAEKFPNDSINELEKCSLHTMISSTIETKVRGDERNTCTVIFDHLQALLSNDVDEFDLKKKGELEKIEDPSAMYLTRNQETLEKIRGVPEESKCPTEKGVLFTKWGTVSGGAIIAAIAATLQSEPIQIKNLIKTEDLLGEKILNTAWFAALTGDLAEMILVQGPDKKQRFEMGTPGNWNSTELPRWYFINNEFYEFTRAEMKGDIDALVLAKHVENWINNNFQLKLSQILDMYYSPRGVFNSSIRACNRLPLFKSLLSLETLKQETLYAITVLGNSDLAPSINDNETRDAWTKKAVQEFIEYFPREFRNVEKCEETDRNFQNFSHSFVDLKLYIDTSWEFEKLQPFLQQIFEGIEVGKFNSNFTLLNANNGSVIINSTNSILDFYALNSSNYAQLGKGFNLGKIFDTMHKLQTKTLEKERFGEGGQKSDITLIMPSSKSPQLKSDQDEYINNQLTRIREQVPDAVILILDESNTDNWSRAVLDPKKDVIHLKLHDVRNVLSRIKEVPKRLINTQCGADYDSRGSSNSSTDYIEPKGINFYRMHPNYFFDSGALIRIQSRDGQQLEICVDRQPITLNVKEKCRNITDNKFEESLSCGDSKLIKDCQPFYISVRANSTSYNENRCDDFKVCRYPDMIKYNFEFQKLECRSGTSTIFLSVVLVFKFFIYYLIF